MFRKSALIIASVLAMTAFAVPASAAEVKVSCPAGATVMYEPAKAGKDMLFNTKPRVIGVTCNPQAGTYHVLSGSGFGWNAPNATFLNEEDVGKFLASIGSMVDDLARKKTAQK